MDLGLNGKRALVIGASRGLGAAIAKTLAAEGATVIAAARRVEAIDGWIAEIPAEIRGRVEAAQLDLSVVESVDGLCDRLLEAGGVDILVGNSGGPPPAEAREAKREDWLVHFEAMAANLFHLTQRLVPPMAQRGWGRIVTIASSGVEQPIPRLALSNGIQVRGDRVVEDACVRSGGTGNHRQRGAAGPHSHRACRSARQGGGRSQQRVRRGCREGLDGKHSGRPLRPIARIRRCGSFSCQ